MRSIQTYTKSPRIITITKYEDENGKWIEALEMIIFKGKMNGMQLVLNLN